MELIEPTIIDSNNTIKQLSSKKKTDTLLLHSPQYYSLLSRFYSTIEFLIICKESF